MDNTSHNLLFDTSTSLNFDSDHPVFEAIDYFDIVAEIIIGILSIAGNLFVLVAIATVTSLKTLTNYFVASLALADLLVGLIGIPCVIAVKFGYPADFYGCLMMNNSIIILTQVSIFGLLVVALDRFFAIKYPFQYMAKGTPRKALIVIVLSWASGLIVGLIPLFGWNNKKKETYDPRMACSFLAVIDMNYMIYFNFFICVALPLVILYLIYAYIYSVVRKQLNQISSLTLPYERSAAALERSASAQAPGNSIKQSREQGSQDNFGFRPEENTDGAGKSEVENTQVEKQTHQLMKPSHLQLQQQQQPQEYQPQLHHQQREKYQHQAISLQDQPLAEPTKNNASESYFQEGDQLSMLYNKLEDTNSINNKSKLNQAECFDNPKSEIEINHNNTKSIKTPVKSKKCSKNFIKVSKKYLHKESSHCNLNGGTICHECPTCQYQFNKISDYEKLQIETAGVTETLIDIEKDINVGTREDCTCNRDCELQVSNESIIYSYTPCENESRLNANKKIIGLLEKPAKLKPIFQVSETKFYINLKEEDNITNNNLHTDTRSNSLGGNNSSKSITQIMTAESEDFSTEVSMVNNEKEIEQDSERQGEAKVNESYLDEATINSAEQEKQDEGEIDESVMDRNRSELNDETVGRRSSVRRRHYIRTKRWPHLVTVALHNSRLNANQQRQNNESSITSSLKRRFSFSLQHGNQSKRNTDLFNTSASLEPSISTTLVNDKLAIDLNTESENIEENQESIIAITSNAESLPSDYKTEIITQYNLNSQSNTLHPNRSINSKRDSRVSTAASSIYTGDVRRIRGVGRSQSEKALRKHNFSKDTKAAKWMAIVLAAFTICWLPLHLNNTIAILAHRMCTPCIIPTVLLSHLNSAINPVLYAFGNSRFLVVLKRVLNRIKPRSNKVIPRVRELSMRQAGDGASIPEVRLA